MTQDYSEFRPSKLWKRMPADRRLAAAELFWADEQSAEQQIEAIAAIAADHPDTARLAAAAIAVEYDVLDPVNRAVIDRALSGAVTNPWPRWERLLGLGEPAGVMGQPAAAVPAVAAAAPDEVKAAKPRAPRPRKTEV